MASMMIIFLPVFYVPELVLFVLIFFLLIVPLSLVVELLGSVERLILLLLLLFFQLLSPYCGPLPIYRLLRALVIIGQILTTTRIVFTVYILHNRYFDG